MSLLAAFLLVAALCASRVLEVVGTAQSLVGDAYVDRNESGDTWTIGNGAFRYAVTRSPSAGLIASELVGADGVKWEIDRGAEASFTVGGRRAALGTAQAPLVRDLIDVWEGGARLRLVFTVTGEPLQVTRHYVVYPGAPDVECWLEFAATGTASPTVADIIVWQQGLQASDARWINGLQAGVPGRAAFARRHEPMTPGHRVRLSSDGRSSSETVPLVWVEGAPGQLVAGLMWSGAWGITAARQGLVTQVSLDLGRLASAVAPGHPLETPHVFVGVTPGGLAASSAGLRAFVEHGVRRGRPFEERVIYNTWFAYGVQIDEASMQAQIRHAAELGVELFVLDAGWYVGGTDVADDFTAGLGSWAVDDLKFPSGLRALADYARETGLGFGLWVEPERVSMATVDQPGLARREWLAAEDGSSTDGSSQSGQICLADPEARQWVLDRLFALVDDVQPDYLKWDNNGWVNCGRTGHGHGTRDGNFAHVRALYEVLAALRERYPHMAIENCSGGGNRLDFGMLRLTDVAWMDDQTAPSAHVRANLEGLSLAFPAPYLFSFVMSWGVEDLRVYPDLPFLFRSRMPGLLGLTYVATEFPEEPAKVMRQEVERYRRIRGDLRDATTVLLTEQASESQVDRWDVIQTVSQGSGASLLFAFQGEAADPSVRVWPQHLDPSAWFVIESVDTGALGAAFGARLMDEGLEIEASPWSRAQVLILTPGLAPDPPEPEPLPDPFPDPDPEDPDIELPPAPEAAVAYPRPPRTGRDPAGIP